MNNEEIRELLRELKESSEQPGEVKSETVRIEFDPDEPEPEPEPEKPRKQGSRRTRPKKESREKTAEETGKGSGQGSTEPSEEDSFGEDLFPEFTNDELPETEDEPSQKPSAAKKTQAEKKSRVRPSKGRKAKEKAKESADETGEESAQAKLSESDSEDTGSENPMTEDERLAADFEELEHAPKKKKPGKIRRFFENVGFAVGDFFADLKGRGIGAKELLMIAVVVLLVVFIVFAVTSTFRSGKNSENVTADEGLTVHVQEEPQEWVSHGTVVLDIRANALIQSVTANGSAVEIEPGRRVKISLDAQSELLELSVKTEEQTLKASVDLLKIDSKSPQVSVKQENGTVTISAVDDRSGVQGIYYGVLDGMSNVPIYESYTGPFAYEQGRTYFYYAQDKAGNRTVPAATTMEPAQTLAFNETGRDLFPGESFSLRVFTSPSLSYCNGLQVNNRTPDLIRLDEDGTVTALKDGLGVIEASAEGLSPVTCQVQVRSSAEVTVSAVGDCTLGSDINFGTANSFDTVWALNGSGYFFQNVREILSDDDVTFANLEGALTTSDERQSKQYAFKGSPEYTDILNDGSVEVVTLANNHSGDYGAQGLSDTKQALKDAGITYCDGNEVAVRDVNGVRTAFIGIYVLDEGSGKSDQVRNTIAAAKKQGARLIIVGFHWGSEKSEWPDEIQRELAHLAIDCGADLVLGHHPHVLEGIELYQGKYIVYSLANFCFGGNSTPSDLDTMIFQQTFRVEQSGVQDLGIRVIPCLVSSAAYGNNYQPTPAQGTDAERIINRINEYSAAYGVTIPQGTV